MNASSENICRKLYSQHLRELRFAPHVWQVGEIRLECRGAQHRTELAHSATLAATNLCCERVHYDSMQLHCDFFIKISNAIITSRARPCDALCIRPCQLDRTLAVWAFAGACAEVTTWAHGVA